MKQMSQAELIAARKQLAEDLKSTLRAFEEITGLAVARVEVMRISHERDGVSRASRMLERGEPFNFGRVEGVEVDVRLP